MRHQIQAPHTFCERTLRRTLADRGVRSISQLARLTGLSEGFTRVLCKGRLPSEVARARLVEVLGAEAVDLIWSTAPQAEARP